MGPSQHPLAFGGDALKGTVAFDDGDAQLSLQFAQACRKGWLGDMTAFRRAREMAMPVKSDQIDELAHEHDEDAPEQTGMRGDTPPAHFGSPSSGAPRLDQTGIRPGLVHSLPFMKASSGVWVMWLV